MLFGRACGFVDAKRPGAATRPCYRLQQVALAGTFAYAPVSIVAQVAKARASLALFPNPAPAGPCPGGAATPTGAVPGAAVTIYDAVGRQVTSAPADASGTATLVLPAGRPAGLYVVRAGTRAPRLTVE